jgi:hypothetical protein
MPEEHLPTIFATEFAKELADKIPVKEVLSPAARPAGEILSDVVKVIQLALAPLQFAAAYQDRLRGFIDKSVRRVPEENRVAPPPQILGPVMEGIRYEPEGTPIDEMFSELLSRSMDSERAKEAHPAFPILIKQLSADEAKILNELFSESFSYVYTRDYDSELRILSPQTTIDVDELPREGLVFPENVPFYMEHLTQLGLAGIYQVGNQKSIYAVSEPRKQVGVWVQNECRLTEMGRRFVQACR